MKIGWSYICTYYLSGMKRTPTYIHIIIMYILYTVIILTQIQTISEDFTPH